MMVCVYMYKMMMNTCI